MTDAAKEWRRLADIAAADVERRAASRQTGDPREELRREIAEALGHYLFTDHVVDAADALLPLIEAREARVRRETLEAAADAIQALHPGEVKNSVTFLRARAATGGQET